MLCPHVESVAVALGLGDVVVVDGAGDDLLRLLSAPDGLVEVGDYLRRARQSSWLRGGCGREPRAAR